MAKKKFIGVKPKIRSPDYHKYQRLQSLKEEIQKKEEMLQLMN